MPLLPLQLPLATGGLPISPTVFMLVTVCSACFFAVIIVFNFLSLKRKSTSRICVAAVNTLLAGLLVSEASIGLLFNSEEPDILSSIPGKVGLGILILAAVVSIAGVIHSHLHQHRSRRGRKRAYGSLVVSLLVIGVLLGASHVSKGPHTPSLPRTKVALLPETDAYGRPLQATPAPATPSPATPAPATPPPATPVPLTPLPPIATPPPPRLLPNVITP